MNTCKRFFILFFLCTLSFFSFAGSNNTDQPTVVFHTNKGDITIRLFPKEAPVTVANFLEYVNSGFYDNTIFHRVIKRFVIQGGGFSPEMTRKQTRAPIINESNNGLHNDRWTLSMARTNDPDSATSQFFINLRANGNLDRKGGNAGYAVFAEVIDGFDVVSAIAKTPTKTVTRAIGSFENVPVENIIIQSAEVVNAKAEG